MSTLTIALVLFALLLLLLVAGVWIAIALAAVAWFGLAFFTATPPEVNLFQAFWGSSANWTIAALPLFVVAWGKSSIARSSRRKCSTGSHPGSAGCPGVSCTSTSSRAGSSVRCRLFGRDVRDDRQGRAARVEETRLRREDVSRVVCGAGTLGILLPPSIIMVSTRSPPKYRS